MEERRQRTAKNGTAMTAVPSYTEAVYTVVSVDGGETAEYVQAGAISREGEVWEAHGSGQLLGAFDTRLAAQVAVRKAWWGPGNAELFEGGSHDEQ